MRIARSAVEIEAAELILRVGVTEIGRGVGEHLARAGCIRHDRRIGNPVEIIVPQRHEGVGHNARLCSTWRLVRMGVGDLTEIDEGTLIILGNTIADGIHTANFPLCREVPLIGGILKSSEGFRLVPALRCAGRAA